MAVARRPNFVFPVLLIVGGGVLLLASAGAVSADAGWRLLDLWPLILVAVGIQLVAWRLFSQPAASAIALTAIGLLAVGAFAYAIGGPALTTGGTSHVSWSAPGAGVESSRLTIDAAGSQVRLTAADTGTDLYRGSADYSGSAPRFSYTPGDLQLSTGRMTGFNWNRTRDSYDITVSSSVPWTVVINGAGVTTSGDLSAGRLQSLSVNGVGSTVNLSLGAPSGTVTVNLSGVGTTATITVPAGTEYRAAASGVGTSVSGTTQTPGWTSAADRYDISASGIGANLAVKESAS